MAASPQRLTTFRNDGLSFDVIDEGPIDGEAIVLLHGFPQTATSWGRVTPILNDAGYRTLAPHQRGYSPQARPKGRRSYTIDKLVGDVVALIDEVGGPVHLAGHDWGAIVAWSMATDRPELLRSLTTVSVPHPMAFLRSMARSTQLLHSYYMFLFQIPGLPERALSNPTFLRRALRQAGMDDDGIAATQREIIDTGATTTAINWYRALPFAARSRLRTKVTVPTTHVWSDDDIALTRAGAELTEDYVVGSYRYVPLEGSHWIPDQQPETLAQLIIERASSVTNA